MRNITTRLTIIIFGLLCIVFLCCLKLTYNIIPRFTVIYGGGMRNLTHTTIPIMERYICFCHHMLMKMSFRWRRVTV